MKYAFMTFSCPDFELDAVLGLAARLDYDGVELRVGSRHAHAVDVETSPEQRREVVRKAQKAGVELCCVATSCRYMPPQELEAAIEDTRRHIDLAGDLGASRIRVFGGKFPWSLSREQAIDRLVTAFNALGDHAQERGVVVCLETHDDWCDPEPVAEVMRRVDHPAIGVNWDIIHPCRVAALTQDKAFEILRPWIRHVHVRDGVAGSGGLHWRSLGEGAFDVERVFRLLTEMGYEGYLSGEWINWRPAEDHLPQEIEKMKSYGRKAAAVG